jgi:hypothetical protein
MLVFLSYSREDQDRIGQVRADLEDLGHTVWLDRRLSGGVEWWTTILGQIRLADVFLLCVTESSLRSEACLAELRYAWAVNRLVLPLRLAEGPDASLAPAPLPLLQWIPYLSGDKSELVGLVRTLSGGLRDLPDPLPPDPPVPGSYLITLSAQIRTTDRLDLGGQLLILHRIRSGMAQVRQPAALAALLDEFRGRHDLLAEVLPELDRLRAQLSTERSTASEDGDPPRRVSPSRAVQPVRDGTGPATGRADAVPSTSPEPPRADAVAAPAPEDAGAATGGRSGSAADAVHRAVVESRSKKGIWHYGSDIPDRFRNKITRRFPLEEGEQLVAVLDMTALGTGGKYVAFTDRHLLHHQLPRALDYSEIDPTTVTGSPQSGEGAVAIGEQKLYLMSAGLKGDEFAAMLQTVLRRISGTHRE